MVTVICLLLPAAEPHVTHVRFAASIVTQFMASISEETHTSLVNMLVMSIAEIRAPKRWGEIQCDRSLKTSQNPPSFSYKSPHRGVGHRSLVVFLNDGQEFEALIFTLLLAWTSWWINPLVAVDFRPRWTHSNDFCSPKKMILRPSSAKWRLFCSGLNFDKCKDRSVYTPSQWEMVLQYNAVSHWLGAYAEWSLQMLHSQPQSSGITRSMPWLLMPKRSSQRANKFDVFYLSIWTSYWTNSRAVGDLISRDTDITPL